MALYMPLLDNLGRATIMPRYRKNSLQKPDVIRGIVMKSELFTVGSFLFNFPPRLITFTCAFANATCFFMNRQISARNKRYGQY